MTEEHSDLTLDSMVAPTGVSLLQPRLLLPAVADCSVSSTGGGTVQSPCHRTGAAVFGESVSPCASASSLELIVNKTSPLLASPGWELTQPQPSLPPQICADAAALMPGEFITLIVPN
jgi:hypothetical protein